MEKTEKYIFLTGIVLFIVMLLFFLISSLLRNEFAFKIMAVILGTVIGGRMAAIFTGIELGLYSLYIIIILFIFNTAWLFIIFPLISTFYHRVIEIKILGKVLHSTKRTAQIQKDKITQYGAWGLPVFIWLPFPWTGAVIGAVIGFLLGISTKKIMLISVISMLIGVISWTYGFQYMLYFTGTAGKIVSIIFLLLILFSSVMKKNKIHIE